MSDTPTVEFTPSGEALANWSRKEPDGRILCQLCPRACRLKPGDRGFCFVRVNRDDRLVLDTYGRSTGFCIDPIEKKPLNHFLPGTPVLSFGTAGCNLGCKFCQNWDISKSREVARLSERAMPIDIAEAAAASGCRSVAFTYNDPVIWAEYAIDTAVACRQRGIKTVAVTAGYITPDARSSFFANMDAANIDLKAFTEDFYFRLTGAHLEPVLDTIRYVVNETDCWVELTNLVIPEANDHQDEFRRMCDWVLSNLGPNVPLHFTAFHPDFRMRDRSSTPHETLLQAQEIARREGVHYPYVGNVHDVQHQSTYCPKCGQLLIERDWYQLGRYELSGHHCSRCGFEIAGRFESPPGTWGRRRQPIQIKASDSNLPIVTNSRDALRRENTMTSPPLQSPVNLLSDEQLRRIQRAASEYVAAIVQGQSFDLTNSLGDLANSPIAGIYVTLKRGQTLRGCCGLQGKTQPLAGALADAATRTAKHDPRMSPIAAVELPYLTLGISILGAARPIGVTGEDRAKVIEIGRHGLRIRLGKHVGLLLPVVASERNWTPRQFLDAVCQKAGLSPGTWLRDDAIVEIFDGVSHTAALQTDKPPSDRPTYPADKLERLRAWVDSNLVAFRSGATPFYYATDAPDMTVAGAIIAIETDEHTRPDCLLQLNLREGIPLQSSMFQLTQSLAQTKRSDQDARRIDIGVLSSVVHHGIDTDHDLGGVDGNSRAIILMDGKHWAIGFDPTEDPANLLRRVQSEQPFRKGSTNVYSAICDATCQLLSASSGPRAECSLTTRPPAVAGSFYPAEDAARESLVDELLTGLPNETKRTVAAAMVPHAGLVYSGRIAADVWRRIQIPSRVLIIGPKHTPDGLDWAVAPHDRWQLSATASITGDVEMANLIATSVPGMALDANAHRREHGIEVQLPLLHRLAPSTRLSGIAMTGGTIGQLRKAAKALAKCLTEIDDPPLLVISSDMNHFADDQENRRRDRMALDVFSQNDPEGLLSVCQRENISMCGQVAAAFVLMTLQEMPRHIEFTEIGYGTSGDVTGDLSRVVGYAGVLL